MNLLPEEPSSIAKVLDTSFKLYKSTFSRVIGYSMMAALISAVVAYVMSSIMQDIAQTGDMSDLLDVSFLYIGGIFIAWGLMFAFFSAEIYRIDNFARQQEDTFSEALIVGFRKLPAMLLAVFLYYIAVVLGMLLLIIPGLILLISLFLYSYYIVLEDNSAFQALKASHKVIWNDWWRTVTVFTVPGILLVIIYFIYGLLVGFLGFDDNEIQLIELVLNLFSGLYMPYFLSLGYVVYHDLKLRKSGSDLEARMKA